MKKVIGSERIPVKMWLDDIEAEALEQAKNLANLPFAFKHIAIMPDSHKGYGMPIGGVLATDGVVIPNAVGVDIGCGMCAMRTSVTSISVDCLKVLLGKIRERIPVGFEHHKEGQDEIFMPDNHHVWDKHIVIQEYKSAMKQVGTLGGGNHFIEIQKGSDGYVWVMIHSGSRNLGKKVADHYNKIAKKLNETWHSSVDPKHDLAFLPSDTTEAKDYMREMQYCVDFALANRKLMMRRIMEAFTETMLGVSFDPIINIAHNYARWENHFNRNVIVHRKGATSAKEGEIGIIPGSMGTSSYIVKGLGNPESFMSCSHGAGRKMGRAAAQRNLDLAVEIGKMNNNRIIHGMRNKSDLEEAPGAYKDIEQVMANQSDLVEIMVALCPLGVIKG